ncbi:MAG: hypothetical protein IJ796_10730 [Lachnospiraceae bacterium]|nr:hypothetical protein [Lachnospiraceae bacterium]
MKKLSDTYVFAILLILAVALFLVVYFVPLKNTNDEIDSLERSNTSLRSEISELQVYHDNRAQYEADTETLKKEIVNVIESYPSGYRTEDYILEGIAMENASDFMQYSAIRINDPEILQTISEESMQNAEIEGYTNAVEFKKQTVDYSNELTYGSLKQALEEAFASGYRANIESVTYTKDEAGVILNGVTTLGYYYVSGNGREYVPPVIEKYEAGTDNIFTGGHSIDMTEFLTDMETSENTAEGQ